MAGEGFSLADERNLNDLIGAGYGQEIDWFLLPVEDLDPDFLNLRTGILGAAFQKFENYRMKVAFVGDISTQLAASKAFTDFVRETNQRKRLVFVSDVNALLTLTES